MTPPLDLDVLRDCKGIGRNVLEARIKLLCDQLETARHEAVLATDKATELLEHRRRLVAHIEALAAAVMGAQQAARAVCSEHDAGDPPETAPTAE